MPAKPKPAFPNPAAVLPGEADILAAVLSDLSDDTAKLVYADWLEDRDDPRGPLLRKFVTAFRAGKKLPAVKPSPWRDLVGLTLMDKLRGTALEPKADAILALARPALSINYNRAPEESLAIGTSRFGARPGLPADAEWPMDGDAPLTFLAQFNLAELHASPVARELPATGLLSLFCLYDYGEDFTDTNWRLIHVADPSVLFRHDTPADLPAEDAAPSCRLSFTEALTLPHPGSPWRKELQRIVGGATVDYENLRDGMGDFGLLGYPFTFEGDVLGKKSVRHLFTTGDHSGINWFPDGNIMYVTVPAADLKRGRFDRAKATLQVV